MPAIVVMERATGGDDDPNVLTGGTPPSRISRTLRGRSEIENALSSSFETACVGFFFFYSGIRLEKK